MVRDYEVSDLPQIKAIHEDGGLDYNLPSLDSPLCLVKKVYVVDGHVVAAMFLRLTAETYLLVSGEPGKKMDAMEALQPAVLDEAYSKGLDEVVAVIPDSILKRFAKRLKQLGWNKGRDGWILFSRSTRRDS